MRIKFKKCNCEDLKNGDIVHVDKNGNCVICGSNPQNRFSAEARKKRPLYSGLLKYFPKALMEVAHCSYIGNQQHHPDKPLHWDKSKSKDHADALMRHLLEAGTIDTDGVSHTTKVAWRALALLEEELDKNDINTDITK